MKYNNMLYFAYKRRRNKQIVMYFFQNESGILNQKAMKLGDKIRI